MYTRAKLFQFSSRAARRSANICSAANIKPRLATMQNEERKRRRRYAISGGEKAFFLAGARGPSVYFILHFRNIAVASNLHLSTITQISMSYLSLFSREREREKDIRARIDNLHAEICAPRSLSS